MLRLKLGLLFVSVAWLTVTLSGCGGTASGGQPHTSSPTLTISKHHNTNFPPGGTGEYSIQITNTGSAATSGTVTVTDSVPTGLTAKSISGTGWTCTLSSVSCSRSDELSQGSSYSTITLMVNVGNTTGTVTNQATVSGGGAPNATASDPTVIGNGQINHVVIIFQENRTVDTLFQELCNQPGSPGCDPTGVNQSQYDIASSGLISTGQTVPLTPTSDGLVTTYDLDHGHDAFLEACDYQSSTNTCKMDGANLITCGPTGCPQYPQYQYVPATGPNNIQPYLTMAETYTFGDHMFQTNQGPSFPAHQYIISGTSAVCDPANCPSGITSTQNDADNPTNNDRSDGSGYFAGCLAPPGSEINAIDTSQSNPKTAETVITVLCNEHPTLTDLLDAAGISWTYYAPMAGSIWTAPDAIQHMCVPSPAYPSQTSECTGSDWTNHVVIEGSNSQILTDIANGQLAAVSWVIPNGQASDHADVNDGKGPSWVAAIVNAVGQSPYWADTAIIIAWDDWGGWYDHMPPSQIRDSYEYGLRVPLIVISPYVKAKYISKVNHDFGSILKFVESVFDLGEIDPSVGYADSRSDDLSDCFNFSQAPLTFTPIQADIKADHFLHDNTPPLPPDDD